MSEEFVNSLFEIRVRFIFAHSSKEPLRTKIEWDDPWDQDHYAAENLAFITQLFENAGEALAPYTNGQILEGLSYLIDLTYSNTYILTMVDNALPQIERIRGIYSIYSLFEQIFAKHCTGSACDEIGEFYSDPLSSFCYSWAIQIPVYPRPDDPNRAEIDKAFLECMRNILTLENSVCQKSALLWIGGGCISVKFTKGVN